MNQAWRPLPVRVPLLAWAGAVLGAVLVVVLQADPLAQREQLLAQHEQLLAQLQQPTPHQTPQPARAPMPTGPAHEPPLAERVQQHPRVREQADERQQSWPALVQADALWLALQGWLVQQGLQVRELRAEAGSSAQALPFGGAWRSVHLSVQGSLAAWRGVWAAWMASGWWWRIERMSITPLQADQVLVQASWSLALRDAEPLPGPVLAALPVPRLEPAAVAVRTDDNALRWVGWWERGEVREAVLAQGAQWLRVPVGALVGSSGLRLREGSAQTLVLVRDNAPRAAPLVLRWGGQETSP